MPSEKLEPAPPTRPDFDRPRDLTPQEIESLRQDSRDSHAKAMSHFKKLKAEGHPALNPRFAHPVN